MIFKELVDKFTWEELIPAFQHLYPDEKLEGYRVALEELRSLEPEPSNMEIELGIGLVAVPDEDYDEYVDVYALEDNTRYALDFTPWTEWLSMSVSPVALEEYEPKAILVHCLWEMTFYAYSNAEILEKRKKLFAAVEEIESEDAE